MAHNRRYFIPWRTLGAVEAFCFGVPFLVLSVGTVDPWDKYIASIFPTVGVILLGIQTVLLARKSKRSYMEYLISFVGCGIVGVIILASVNYVSRKLESKHKDTSPIEATQRLSENSQVVFPPFNRLYENNKEKLGKPIRPVQEVEGAYYAAHEAGDAVFLINDPRLYIINPLNFEWTTTGAISWDGDPKWSNDLWLRKRFKTPPDKSPPFSGVAYTWDREPGKWEWMKWRKWHCNMGGDVYYQKFEHGIIIGPFLYLPTVKIMKAFALINDGESNDKGKYDAITLEEGKVPNCAAP